MHSPEKFCVVFCRVQRESSKRLQQLSKESSEVVIMQNKGFVAMAALFMMNCSFHLAKLIRDLGDPVMAARAHLSFQALVYGSFVVSVIFGIVGVYLMNIPDPKKRFIINGLCFIVCQSLALAKLTRDKNECTILMKKSQTDPVIDFVKHRM